MIPIPDYATVILPQVMAFLRNRFPGKDSHTESFLGKIGRALARTISYLLVSLQSVDQDATPSQKTSLTALANMAFAYGIPSNAGGFGPNGPNVASGGVGLFTGTKGQSIPDGTLLTAPDGVTVLKTSGAQTIPGTPPGSGSVSCNIVAVTTGSAGNLPTNTTLTLQSPPTGIDGTATLTSPTTGGLDSESKTSLLGRILARFQTPPKAGAAPDYRAWAETVSGVARAYVYPKRHGGGTVDVVITAAGSGAGRDPGATVQTNVSNYINGNSSTNPVILPQRSVTSSGTNILRPYVAGAGLAIRVRGVVSAQKYAFDWALGTATLTVASYAAPTITAVESLPASLMQAVDAYTASPSTVTPPRLQIISTGIPAPGIAVPVYVIAYNAGAKTLTLQTPLPSTWTAPTAGNPIYPYGNAVPIVAAGAFASSTPPVIAGVQGYIDGLGPSRAGGYASALDVWNDTASVFGIGEVALDATDIDGATRPFSRLLAVTINGGTADVQATDTVANGVQLLTCASIAITD